MLRILVADDLLGAKRLRDERDVVVVGA